MSPFYLAVAIFVLMGIAGTALWAALAGRYQMLDERFSDMQVKMRVTYGSLNADEIDQESVARAIFRWVIERLPEPKLDTPAGENITRLMMQAGHLSSGAARTFQLVRLACAIAGATGAALLDFAVHAQGMRPIMLIVGGAVLGAWLPYFMVTRKASARQREIASQLSDALDLLVVCVEAGLGINEAIKIVGSETDRQGQEIGRELALVSAELTAGASLGQALRALAERTSVEDIKPLAATLIQSEQLGAQMGPTLKSISDGLRNARKLRAEEAAQKTTVKILFPLVFFVLPAMMSVIVGPALIQIMRTMSGRH
jgi:tight adherence protein C